MQEQEKFNEELNEIRKDMMIELKEWWGSRFGGYGGTIVTQSKEVYIYQYYHRIPENMPEDFKKNCIYIRKAKNLSESEFEKICAFIENEIIDKQFEIKMVRDAGYDIEVNYNGVNKVIINNKSFGDDLEVYDMAEKLLKEILG